MSLLDKFRKKIEKKVEKKVEKEESKEEVLPKKIIGKQTPRIYQVIREPHITEKATLLTEQDKYIFKVSPKANKTETKKAIESLYGVKVKKVDMIHMPSKRRRLGKSQGWRHGLKKGFKKAIVTLEKGGKIELLPR